MKLIATDIDHTLLTDDGTVSPRTRAALDRARAAGVMVLPVTGRQPIGVRAIVNEAGFDNWAICSNGSLAFHLKTQEKLFAEEAPAAALQRLAETLNQRIPGLVYASVRGDGDELVPQHGYNTLARFEDHKREPEKMSGVSLAEVLAEPSLKLVVRHAEVHHNDIFDTISKLGLTGFGFTMSGAPFVEIMAEGVTKAAGLERVCAHLGIDRSEVVAFGDGLNDVEMLRWAGHGVAVANAQEQTREAADEVTAANTEDGVARVIERLLG